MVNRRSAPAPCPSEQAGLYFRWILAIVLKCSRASSWSRPPGPTRVSAREASLHSRQFGSSITAAPGPQQQRAPQPRRARCGRGTPDVKPFQRDICVSGPQRNGGFLYRERPAGRRKRHQQGGLVSGREISPSSHDLAPAGKGQWSRGKSLACSLNFSPDTGLWGFPFPDVATLSASPFSAFHVDSPYLPPQRFSMYPWLS